MFLNLLFSLSLVALALGVFNAVTIVTISNRFKRGKPTIFADPVALLVPMRNEEKHVRELLDCAFASESLANLSIYALDDSSSDQTLGLLNDAAGSTPNLHILSGRELENDWMGKPFACHQLAERAIADGAEFLIFLDADTRISPTAIAASLSAMKARGWDFISPHPREIASSPLARLIQPLMQWSWFVSVPVRLGIALKIPSMAIANGQFIIFSTHAYQSAGGHAMVRNEVIEDLEISRTLVRAGFRGGVAVAADVVECQMYENDAELRRGYAKSLWRAFGSPIGALLAAALLLSTQTLPFLLALFGSLVAWKIVAVNALAHLIVALKTRSNPVNTFAHPLAIVLLVGLIVDSFIQRARGVAQWKGRVIA